MCCLMLETSRIVTIQTFSFPQCAQNYVAVLHIIVVLTLVRQAVKTHMRENLGNHPKFWSINNKADFVLK